MATLDVIEFFQALLATFFLNSLSVLVPKLLAAVSRTSQSPMFSSYIENLYRHNPFHQWMAERQLARQVIAARFRALDERTGNFLARDKHVRRICPNRKWLFLSVVFICIYVFVNIIGALTIMWQESVESPVNTTSDTLYPAFPVTAGQNLMTLRGNCKWVKVEGSGDVDKVGFVIYQLCLDVFEHPKDEKLARNEVRAVTTLGDRTKYWRMTWSLETITQDGIEEEWKVSHLNEDRLENARGERDYLQDCDAECNKVLRADGPGKAMIIEALKEAGMVERSVEHYDRDKPDFNEHEFLKDRKTRLKSEAWITMLAVTVVALLWSTAGLIKSSEETDFAIVTRMVRSYSNNGPTAIDSVLRPGVQQESGFVRAKRKLPKAAFDNHLRRRKHKSGKDEISDDLENWGIRPRDIDMADEEEGIIVLRVADFVYGVEHGERAKDGMIVVANRFEEDDDSDDDFGGASDAESSTSTLHSRGSTGASQEE